MCSNIPPWIWIVEFWIKWCVFSTLSWSSIFEIKEVERLQCAPKDKTPKRDFSCAETASVMSSFQTLRIRLYVLRKGFPLQFDSGDRIETINPTSGGVWILWESSSTCTKWKHHYSHYRLQCLSWSYINVRPNLECFSLLTSQKHHSFEVRNLKAPRIFWSPICLDITCHQLEYVM